MLPNAYVRREPRQAAPPSWWGGTKLKIPTHAVGPPDLGSHATSPQFSGTTPQIRLSKNMPAVPTREVWNLMSVTSHSTKSQCQCQCHSLSLSLSLSISLRVGVNRSCRRAWNITREPVWLPHRSWHNGYDILSPTITRKMPRTVQRLVFSLYWSHQGVWPRESSRAVGRSVQIRLSTQVHQHCKVIPRWYVSFRDWWWLDVLSVHRFMWYKALKAGLCPRTIVILDILPCYSTWLTSIATSVYHWPFALIATCLTCENCSQNPKQHLH